ncbi:MAG: RagB/SusD family nutrient uptake outer membrane protein [Haliscomenobacter sp.]|nr:RagB/SusD family nutrient uptake outer membrane protein [Haliscomenobacter sp.]
MTVLLGMWSCTDYLDQTPDAAVSEEDLFGTYRDFQGFLDPAYSLVMDLNGHALTTSHCIGGEVHNSTPWGSGARGNNGDYLAMCPSGATLQSNFWCTDDNLLGDTDSGLWIDSWRGIRIANIALEKLPLLTGATEEERKLIEGQAYFLRAFFHWELIRAWGGMPYVEKAYSPTDDLKLPRLTYQQSTDKLVEDLNKAASLLPTNWDNTNVGAAAKGSNTGRATKGAALSLKAKALLYAGSPLMNKFSGGSAEYNKTYLEKSAAAAWEVIQLANQGVYALVPWKDYQKNFATSDNTMPWTSETIFEKVKSGVGSGELTNRLGRIFTPVRMGGNAVKDCPNQAYVDLFEMADGSRYKEAYDSDNNKRWNGRDPRFRHAICVDRDKMGTAASTVIELFDGGKDRTAGVVTPYYIRKFWPVGVNTIDKAWNGFRWNTPHLRLAEVYLIYAEAVSEAYSPSSTAPGASLTAVEAVNIVRRRANMPDVTATPAGYTSFRELLRNERFVELCFEGHWWYDIRRWYVATQPEYKLVTSLNFDKNWTKFTRSVIFNRVFDERHYWMPIPRSQTLLYPEFGQNPGW